MKATPARDARFGDGPPQAPGRRPAARRPAWRALAAALLLVLVSGSASAQPGPSLSGTFEVRYAAAVGYGAPPALPGGASVREPYATMLAGAHVDLEASWRPLRATVRLDPAMLVPAGATLPTWEPGLSEAFVLLREGPIDASLGLERLPLETARLTVPLPLDPVAADGTRRGLWGARVSAYVGALRLRGAGFLLPPSRGGSGKLGASDVGAAFSARLDLTAAQLEAHALTLEAPAFGVSASGTVARTVVYGEAWLLTGPWRGRAALGASGYLGDALWTLEAAYAPPANAPGLDAAPQLAAQLDVPLTNGDSLHTVAGAGLVEDPAAPGTRRLQVSASTLWETGDATATLRLGPAFTIGVAGVRFALQAQLDAATGF